MVVNQTSMIGPNTRPTDPVPRRWIVKSATMIVTRDRDHELSMEDEIVFGALDRREHRDRRA